MEARSQGFRENAVTYLTPSVCFELRRCDFFWPKNRDFVAEAEAFVSFSSMFVLKGF